VNASLASSLYTNADHGASGNRSSPLSYSAHHAEQGISRSLVEVFAVGPYTYTGLADAVAQARRDRSDK
jgi:hypothetical protein